MKINPNTDEPVKDVRPEGDWSELKLAINNAIWMYAPSNLTLGQCEEAACLCISHLRRSNDFSQRTTQAAQTASPE